jgi:hypothetical protein
MGELTHRMRRIHLEGNKNRRGESKEKSFPLSAVLVVLKDLKSLTFKSLDFSPD